MAEGPPPDSVVMTVSGGGPSEDSAGCEAIRPDQCGDELKP
jgi:hypothetical protein